MRLFRDRRSTIGDLYTQAGARTRLNRLQPVSTRSMIQ